MPATLIFFELPRRLAETLGAMVEALGPGRKAAIGRELTKTFEEMRTGTLQSLADHYAAADTPKGEIVICVGPSEATADEPADIDRLLLVARRRDARLEGGGGGRQDDRRPEAGALSAAARAQGCQTMIPNRVRVENRFSDEIMVKQETEPHPILSGWISCGDRGGG